MKANKRTLMAVKSFLENEQDSWDKEGMVEEIANETKMLVHKDIKNLEMDECEIKWDGDYICNLADFIYSFSDSFIEKFCNVLDSFIDEDISYYSEE